MNIRTIFVALTVACCLSASGALADVPHLINFQGTLTDSSGNPITATLSMEFKIYPLPYYPGFVWTETHPDVEIIDGLYQVQLGSVVPLTPSAFASPERWLEITVEGEVLGPMLQITSMAYGHRAAFSDTADYASSFDIPIHIIDSTPGTALIWATNNTETGYGVQGDNSNTGSQGILGGNDYGAYGRNINYNFGYLGHNDYGAYGHSDNENWGYLGVDEHWSVWSSRRRQLWILGG